MAVILIVDDSPTELHLFQKMLEQDGFDTLVAEAEGRRTEAELELEPRPVNLAAGFSVGALTNFAEIESVLLGVDIEVRTRWLGHTVLARAGVCAVRIGTWSSQRGGLDRKFEAARSHLGRGTSGGPSSLLSWRRNRKFFLLVLFSSGVWTSSWGNSDDFRSSGSRKRVVQIH